MSSASCHYDHVTSTFTRIKFSVHIGVHIKCISICSTYEKLSKNKSCIGCIAWHGMAYYIFLKSLRSLEEFRKILMSKFLLNHLLQISKALVNSKIQFLIQKSFFLAFGPANLAARSASGPASPPAAPSP
jgi:hypothetical protein